jgi:hypothetical protein
MPGIGAAAASPIWAPGDGANLILLARRQLCGGVPQHDVSHFVREEAGERIFVVSQRDHPRADKNRTARERETRHVVDVDDADLVAKCGLSKFGRN